MPRVYHNGAGIARHMAGVDPKARAVRGRPIGPLCFGPVVAGLYVEINIMLAREGL